MWMSALPTLVMETRLATTLMDLSCVCVIEALLVMDLIVQVGTIKRGNCHSISVCTKL